MTEAELTLWSARKAIQRRKEQQEQKKRAKDLSILANMGIEVAEIHGSDEVTIPEWMEGRDDG
jgi:hypothetical protein